MYFNGLLRPKAMFGIEPNYITRSNHSEAGSVKQKNLAMKNVVLHLGQLPYLDLNQKKSTKDYGNKKDYKQKSQ